MNIPELHTALLTPSQGRQSLVVDQVVSGKILGHLPTGDIMLNLEGRHYRASIRGDMLSPGQEALFLVGRTSPRLELSVVRIPAGAEAPTPPAGNPVSGLPAGYLPDAGTALLSLLVRGNINVWPAITPLLQALVHKIRNRALQDGISGGTVRQRFIHSGLFFDGFTSSLNSQTIDTQYHPLQDLKLLLYLLSREAGIISRNFNSLDSGKINKAYKLHYLGQYSGNAAIGPGVLPTGSHGLLACLAQETLERVVANQVKSLEARLGGDTVWHFDLQVVVCSEPLSIPVTIRQEETGNGHRKNGERREAWRVEFTVESRTLGLIQAEILVWQDQVDAGIGAARRQTVSLLESGKPYLVERFASAGLGLALRIFDMKPENGEDDHE